MFCAWHSCFDVDIANCNISNATQYCLVYEHQMNKWKIPEKFIMTSQINWYDVHCCIEWHLIAFSTHAACDEIIQSHSIQFGWVIYTYFYSQLNDNTKDKFKNKLKKGDWPFTMKFISMKFWVYRKKLNIFRREIVILSFRVTEYCTLFSLVFTILLVVHIFLLKFICVCHSSLGAFIRWTDVHDCATIFINFLWWQIIAWEHIWA